MPEAQQPTSLLRFVLTVDDAIAYERLPGELRGWTKFWLIVSLASIGGVYGVLEDWPLWWRWGTCAGLVLLWLAIVIGGYNVRIHRRAKAFAEREGETVVEDWGDSLTVRSGSGVRHLADETIGKVLVGPGHVFILYQGGPTIIPLSAFDGEQEMRAFGQVLDRRSEESAL